MDKEGYARVVAVLRTNEINAYLARGWEIVPGSIAFMPFRYKVNGVDAVENIPHAVMGLPRSLAPDEEKRLAEQLTQATPAPYNTQPPTPEPEPTPDPPTPTPTPEPTPAPAAPVAPTAPLMSRPSGASRLTAPVDINRSEEVMVGVRRS